MDGGHIYYNKLDSLVGSLIEKFIKTDAGFQQTYQDCFAFGGENETAAFANKLKSALLKYCIPTKEETKNALSNSFYLEHKITEYIQNTFK